ncbi:hypothetical protein [Hyphomicrobium sp. MC1]|uniref:hypothetical protein n=1 Tax=Hyphomicrobium sp. (strain MC1) TaxID=717785 RepID=UPI000213DAAB|nr:hypothetical protein [Hyphomicrobium sp. MC1]CCB64464.1 conserved protein of unknown function [Hyphomicrobium sp. MC1]
MMTPSKYFVGGAITLTAQFTGSDGNLADPTTVVLKLKAPHGKLLTYTYGTDANVSKASTGNYEAIVTPDCAGRWFTRWEGTDALGNVLPIEDFIAVQRSRFLHGPDCYWDYL